MLAGIAPPGYCPLGYPPTYATPGIYITIYLATYVTIYLAIYVTIYLATQRIGHAYPAYRPPSI